MVSTVINDFKEKYEPSDLNALERYEILAPILAEATQAYARLYREDPSEKRDAEVKEILDGLFEKAASGTDMSTEEVRRSFQAFSTIGMAGLMAPIELNAHHCAVSFRGTWEMRHRFTNGGRTPHAGKSGDTNARSNMYYELTEPDQNRLTQLTVMWTDENHYARDEAVKRDLAGRSEDDTTFLIASLVKIQLNQIDPYTVEYLDEGEVIGNHGEFANGVRVRNRAVMMRFGSSETLLGVPDSRIVHDDGTEEPAIGMFLLLNAHGCGPHAFAWSMSGLPPMRGDLRSYDTVDTYIKQNNDQPLIGGFEPLEKYYNRLRDPSGFAQQIRENAPKSRGKPHGFHPESLSSLRKHFRRDY